MILARHAEALFWAGRQLERSEYTARALSVTSQNLMRISPAGAAVEWRILLAVLALEERFDAMGKEPTTDAVPLFLFADPDHRGSVVSTVWQLRENIRTVRDRVPVELWEESNRLHLTLHTTDPSRVLRTEPFELYGSVRRGCQAISGVVSEAMPRDEGYAFLLIGRMLERALTTTRLVRYFWARPASLEEASLLDAATLLRLASALQAYRRAEGYDNDRYRLTRFLLQADNVPRSVYSCLRHAELRLDILVSVAPALDASRRLCGRLRSVLEFGAIERSLMTSPIDALLQMEADLAQLARVIPEHGFRPAQSADMRAQFVRPGLDAV